MEITASDRSLTAEDIAGVERRLGVEFPEDLRKLYLRVNGGIPAPDSFEMDGEFYVVQCILPILDPGDGLEGAYVTLVENELLPPDMIPFADDPSGDYFLYCIAPESRGEIHFLQTEYCDDPERLVVALAPSLTAFLDALVTLPKRAS